MIVTKLKLWGLTAVVVAVGVGIGTANVSGGSDDPPAPLEPKPFAREPLNFQMPTVADAPPVVVKTVPMAGADDVDPATTEIKVTFSKDMMDKSMSWSTSPDHGSFPTTPDGAKIAYDKDKRTCVMPVKLEPGKTYAMWINSAKFGNFKDADGRSAVPYLLVFQTKKK